MSTAQAMTKNERQIYLIQGVKILILYFQYFSKVTSFS